MMSSETKKRFSGILRRGASWAGLSGLPGRSPREESSLQISLTGTREPQAIRRRTLAAEAGMDSRMWRGMPREVRRQSIICSVWICSAVRISSPVTGGVLPSVLSGFSRESGAGGVL